MTAAEIDHLTGRGADGPAPGAVGLKFAADGAALRCPGNTFICPIPAGTPTHDALVRAQDRLRTGPQAGAFRFLPPASFHMTVFEGVIDYRREGHAWPEGIDRAMPVDAVTALFSDRLAGADLSGTAGLSVRPTAIFGGFSVRLSGAGEADEAALRALRARLRDLTGIRRDDFASYGFHITLAYPLRWLSGAEAAAVVALSAAAFDDLHRAAPSFVLPAPQFCRFDDMLAFPPLRAL